MVGEEADLLAVLWPWASRAPAFYVISVRGILAYLKHEAVVTIIYKQIGFDTWI
jgi:hypothetical protein